MTKQGLGGKTGHLDQGVKWGCLGAGVAKSRAGLGRVRQVKNCKVLVSISIIRPAVSASCQLLRLSLSFHRDWETEALGFLMISLQRNGP